ncbi:hypothetical protein KJZ71_00925 [Patescibacteria group bacterium]|uniref:Uncharacterized protein n=1 Tax=candidate division WWE3 bacterium TaxID=2053526 RepID=A0A928TSL7_UNCKA|nr:hypothetical protein [candidate division WWE3 bacterium]MCL4732349.1 hypothetical protein [Patescibacteria group bacterium]MDL1952774.1 hypothetical protein [Candidatus Uhrbacteria bacterium UHB]RIL01010.1 MAG: hypothetical protein DCC77_00515 [Candidatus Uhrbacteria bacterium]
MQSLFTFSFWFNLHAVPFLPAVGRALAVLFAALIAGGVACAFAARMRQASKEWRRALGRLSSHLVWTGLIGFLLWMFNEQWVPILSMRFFFVLWFIWFLGGFYPIYRYVWVEVPEKMKLHEERLEREKWLPKKKR